MMNWLADGWWLLYQIIIPTGAYISMIALNKPLSKFNSGVPVPFVLLFVLFSLIIVFDEIDSYCIIYM